MATSPDHPELQFVQALKYAKGRPDGPPLWIVVHDMEASETRTRAENAAQYFATLPDGRSVSSHYTADNDSVVQCVKLADVAYTVGNRPGNYRGINWEFSGFAAQTREQWLDPFGKAMFAQAAPIIRADAARFGIPLERRTVAELKAFKPGVTSHNDLRLAFGGTTHTDPGPNFPWDYFMGLLRDGGDDTMFCKYGDIGNGKVWVLQSELNQLGIGDPIGQDDDYGDETADKMVEVGLGGGDGKGRNYWAGEYALLQRMLRDKAAADAVAALPPGQDGELVPHTHGMTITGAVGSAIPS